MHYSDHIAPNWNALYPIDVTVRDEARVTHQDDSLACAERWTVHLRARTEADLLFMVHQVLRLSELHTVPVTHMFGGDSWSEWGEPYPADGQADDSWRWSAGRVLHVVIDAPRLQHAQKIAARIAQWCDVTSSVSVTMSAASDWAEQCDVIPATSATY